MDFLAPLLLDAMLMPAPHTLCRSASSDSRPTLEEHADGWVITALMPGMDASQVSVETLQQDDGSQLWLHAEPRFRTELRCVPAPQRSTQRARHLGAAAAHARGTARAAGRSARACSGDFPGALSPEHSSDCRARARARSCAGCRATRTCPRCRRRW